MWQLKANIQTNLGQELSPVGINKEKSFRQAKETGGTRGLRGVVLLIDKEGRIEKKEGRLKRNKGYVWGKRLGLRKRKGGMGRRVDYSTGLASLFSSR